MLRAAKLVGAQLDSGALDGLDAAGAALPDTAYPIPKVSRIAPSCVAVTWSDDGRGLASAYEDGSIVLWESSSGRAIGAVANLHELPRTLKFLQGDAALDVWTGSSLHRWDFRTDHVKRLLVETRPALEAAISRELLAFGSSTDNIELRNRWDLEPRGIAVGPVGRGKQLGRMAFSPDERTLAIGAYDGEIHLWDVAMARPACALRGHEGRIVGLAFNAEGTLLASVAADRTARLWDTRAGKLIEVLRGGFTPVGHVALSPEGEWLVSVSMTGMIQLFDVARGEVRRLHGPKGRVVSAESCPDGTLLASASEKGTIGIWTVPGGLCVAVLVHLPGGWVVFSPDGRYKLGGDTAGAFWHEIGDCRFQPGELDPFLPFALRIPQAAPLLERSYASPAPPSHDGPTRAG